MHSQRDSQRNEDTRAEDELPAVEDGQGRNGALRKHHGVLRVSEVLRNGVAQPDSVDVGMNKADTELEDGAPDDGSNGSTA